MEDDTDRSGRRRNPKNEATVGQGRVFLGATLVSSLMNLGLIDELRLMVDPIILGGGKALFKDMKERPLEPHTSQTVEIRQGQLDLDYAILDVMT